MNTGDLVAEIRRLLAERVGADVGAGIADDAPLAAAGVGSLDLLVIVSALEQRFDVTFLPDAHIDELLESVASIAAWVARGSSRDPVE